MMAMALVLSLHVIFSSRAYVRALSRAQLTAHPIRAEARPADAVIPPKWNGVHVPDSMDSRTTETLFDTIVRPIRASQAASNAEAINRMFAWMTKDAEVTPTTYQYRVTVRHWTMPEETYRSETWLVFDLWTDRRIVVTAEGTQPIALNRPVPDTPEGLGHAEAAQIMRYPVTVVSAGGNYFGWLARDLMWIGNGGWLLYACAALIGAAFQLRWMLLRGVNVVERCATRGVEGAVRGVQLGKILADKFDEKVEELNAPDR